MELEFKSGQMEQFMKENGEIIKHMEKEFLDMLMGIYLKENGKMIKLMDMAIISMLQEAIMKVNGKMIISMDMEQNIGKMVQNMKAFIQMVERMEKVIMIIFNI